MMRMARMDTDVIEMPTQPRCEARTRKEFGHAAPSICGIGDICG
jgi:hypothetical protein